MLELPDTRIKNLAELRSLDGREIFTVVHISWNRIPYSQTHLEKWIVGPIVYPNRIEPNISPHHYTDLVPTRSIWNVHGGDALNKNEKTPRIFRISDFNCCGRRSQGNYKYQAMFEKESDATSWQAMIALSFEPNPYEYLLDYKRTDRFHVAAPIKRWIKNLPDDAPREQNQNPKTA